LELLYNEFMKILQWSMTIPEEKQVEFTKYFNDVLGPTFQGFGAIKHELFKVADTQVVGRQLVEKDRFIERVFFENDFNIPSYFAKVKEDPEAWKLSRSYEERFGAKDIELRVLIEP
jgi:hypothetical protein